MTQTRSPLFLILSGRPLSKMHGKACRTCRKSMLRLLRLAAVLLKTLGLQGTATRCSFMAEQGAAKHTS